MNFLMEDVAQFKEAHGHELPDKLTIPDYPRMELLSKLIREEFREVMESIYPRWDTPHDDGRMEVDPVNLAKELADLVYVAVGMTIECGIPLDKVWDEVHRSNMSKIGPDGKFVTREDGKIMKGPNYQAPNIRKALGLE